MIQVKETVYTRDEANYKLLAERDFDAPVNKVWKAWTESKSLDQWWAPKPWKAHTLSMDFREGGRWLYYMEGPEGERHYSKAEFTKIEKEKSFSGLDAFSDKEGNTDNKMPVSNWKVWFMPEGDDATKVKVEVTFRSKEDMDKLLEMGFQDGFAAAHNNLDELLAS